MLFGFENETGEDKKEDSERSNEDKLVEDVKEVARGEKRIVVAGDIVEGDEIIVDGKVSNHDDGK